MGTMKMATYVAERSLLLFCLLAFIVPAKALKCHSCLGNEKECKLTEVTCPASNYTCGSSTTIIKSFPFKVYTVAKGCVISTVPHRKISISPSATVKMSLEEKTCNTDLCNKETIPESKDSKENSRNCYSCISSSKDCNNETLRHMNCRGQQTTCLDIRVIGNFGEQTDTYLKGCGELNCSNILTFSNSRSTVLVKCCNENFCNRYEEFKEPDKKPNGVQCIDCDTTNDLPCSSLNYTTTECYGDQTACYEMAGLKRENGKLTPAVLKGCASPNMCDNSVLPLLQNLKGTRGRCCNGNKCNNNFNTENLQASDFFPETGIKSDPMVQPSYYEQNSVKRPQNLYNPVKTGHTFNNYGPGGTPVSASNNYYNDDNNGDRMDYGELNTLSFAVIDVPTIPPLTFGGKQNNFNYGSWNSDKNGGDSTPTSLSSDGLSGSNLGSIGDAGLSTEIPPTAVNDNAQNQTPAYNSDSYTDVELSTDNDFVLVDSYIESEIDYYMEDDNNLTTTSQGPTQSPGSWDLNSYGGEPNVTSLTSDGVNSAPSGPLSTEIPQGTVNGSLNQQNQTSANNSDLYSPTDAEVFLVGSETDTYYYVDTIVDDESNLTTASQGPTQTEGSWDNNSSEFSYGLNSDSFVLSNSDQTTQIAQETAYDEFLQQDQTQLYNSGVFISIETLTNDDDNGTAGNYSAGVDNSLSTAPQGPNQDTTLLSNNTSNSNIGRVPYILNSSSGGYGANVANKNNPNITSSSYYNCSSFTANAFNNLGQKPGVNNNGSNNGTNSSSSNLIVPSTGGSYYGSSSSNHSTPSSNHNGTSNGSNPMSTSHVHHNGNGSDWGNSSDHNLPMMPPNVYNGSSGYNSSFNGSEYSHVGPNHPNSTNSGNGYLHNSNPKPNSTENVAYNGSGTSRSNSSTHSNGFSDLMPSEVNNNGSNNGTNTSSSNLSMTGGSYNGSSSSNHSTLGSNHNGSFVETSNSSNTMSTGNVHSYGNGSDSSNSSVHNPHMMPPGGYNGSSGYNSNGSFVGNSNSSNPMSTGNVHSYGNGSYSSNSSVHNPHMMPPGGYNGSSGYNSNGSFVGNSNSSNPMSTGNVHSYGNGSDSSNSSVHNPHMMPPGGYNGSSGYNSNGSFVGNSNGSNPMSTGNVHSYGNGSNSSNSSVHNPHMMPPGGYNGSSGYNSNGSFVGNSNGSNPMSTGNAHSYGNDSNSSNSSVHNPHMMPPGGYNGSSGYNSNGSFVGNSNGSNPMSTGNVHSYGNGSNSSNSSVHNPHMMPPGGYNGSSGYNSNGSFVGNSNGSNPMSTGNVHSYGNGSNSSNSSVHNPHMMPPGGYNGSSGYNSNGSFVGNSNGSNPLSTGNVHSYGNGSDSSNSSVHNPHMMAPGDYDSNSHNNSNLIIGGGYINPNMMPPESNNYGNYGNHGNSYGNYYIPSEGAPYGNQNGPGNPYSNYNPNMLPPGVHGPPMEYFNGNGNGNNYNIFETEGNPNENNSGSSYPNMPPPAVPGHYSSVGNIMPNLNGSHSYQLPPGLNWSTNGNLSSLVNVLSNVTGVSPSVLSERLNGTDLSNPANLVAVLFGIPGLDHNRLPPELKAIFDNAHSNSSGINYGTSPSKWDISSFGGRDKFINTLSTAAAISPALLTEKLNGVDISNPSKVASVLYSIPTFDSNRLPPELKAGLVGYTGNAYPNTAGYNNNGMHLPNWNISNLVNNSYFLDALSNMTNISVDVLSQKFNDLNKDGQSNLTALIFSLPGFDAYRLPPEFQKDMFGNTNTNNNNMVPPGSIGHAGNGTNHTDLSLSGKNTNDTSYDNSTITFYSGAHSLKSKAGVLALVFTIILLY